MLATRQWHLGNGAMDQLLIIAGYRLPAPVKLGAFPDFFADEQREILVFGQQLFERLAEIIPKQKINADTAMAGLVTTQKMDVIDGL
ncbi:hypothetical protein CRENPOLYSF2_2130002 [Crenothrix polyspora]|uniref:Uncharacterized protein n=1 Tax=Crenothrix polyspora TaxID=360316 RepID=A0A1R4H4R6_9GAMM|nr:hypothetical protein CRENPOLYSF2_2130002 [Crenothrix polyspora]